jgi:PAS domain S-box-containing protein
MALLLMDSDRNLLFGVLALQAELVTPTQFVEACTLWTARKDTSLADLLVERGWIDAADKSHIDYLVDRKLRKYGGDGQACLASVHDDVKRSLAALNDADIQRSLTGPPGVATVLDAAEDLPAGPQMRYRLMRLHATGGIGRIWLARDADLGRDVALKELRPERANDAALWSRFLKEARITGQLGHPGVVPVYELARRPENQQPFYTMQFIKGRTLTEAAQSYHQKRDAGQADSLEFVTLLNAFVAVCNTVAYAHSRGVIHRDLKGQNIVLGDFGEVVVLDWGLAKLVDRPDPDAATPPITLDSDHAAAPDLTAHGQTLGTPAYMAPEQAAGRLDLIDRRTDVYGLGAMLYEILTGQPPFVGTDTLEVLRRVCEEEPPPPHTLWSDVPPALEGVCLRALAKKPADRHASAAELGQEVQRWQETERRKAEEALRASEALYHSLVETLPLSVWRKDLNGRFTFGNHRFCQSVGRSLAEVVGKTDFDFFPAELAGKYREDDVRVHQSGHAYATAEEHVTASGQKLFVEVVKSPIFDVSGHVIGTQGIFWDVTERKRTEEELRKSRERFELAVQGSQDGLWDWDLTTDEVYYSPRYKAMVAYEDHEFPNRREEWEKRVHPDDLTRVKSEMRDHFQGRESLSWVEFRFRHKDGSYRWIRSRAFVLRDPVGQVCRMAGSFEDITDRKMAEEALRESEARYRSVIAAMQDGIALLDTDGHIVACNASAERILGLSADQLMGRTPRDPRWQSIHEDGSPFPGETHPPMVTLRTGQPCRDVVMGIHKPDGSLTWISINSQPLHKPDGTTLSGVVASFEDITERKRVSARPPGWRAFGSPLLQALQPQSAFESTLRSISSERIPGEGQTGEAGTI